MMKYLASILIAALNFSICTGGVLSAGTAFALQVSQEESIQNMSPSIGDFFLCQTFTPSDVVEDVQEFAGCNEHESCLQQASGDTQERFLFLNLQQYSFDLPRVLKVEYSRGHVADVDWSGTIRAGPLYEQSALVAHVLEKRE